MAFVYVGYFWSLRHETDISTQVCQPWSRNFEDGVKCPCKIFFTKSTNFPQKLKLRVIYE